MQIAERLLAGMYESAHAATRDVRLVWSNALLYWKKGSRAARAAEEVPRPEHPAVSREREGTTQGDWPQEAPRPKQPAVKRRIRVLRRKRAEREERSAQR